MSSVFYGRKSGDDSDASMASMLSDDNSVDDPDFVWSKLKQIGGDDSEGEGGDDKSDAGR